MIALEPGSNDFLIRAAQTKEPHTLSLAVRAPARVVASLPEKLGLGTLAERLQATDADGISQVPAAFVSVDWSAAAKTGNAERGRKLFGADALGCVKCHAVLPNQKGGGAPSLAGAATPVHRRRIWSNRS